MFSNILLVLQQSIFALAIISQVKLLKFIFGKEKIYYSLEIKNKLINQINDLLAYSYTYLLYSSSLLYIIVAAPDTSLF